MSNFADVMATNPLRLVVTFNRDSSGKEQFQWGVAKGIPILNLIAHISRVQADLLNNVWIPECEDVGGRQGLVIVWDNEERVLSHYVHPDVPRDPLAGMLEIIKAILVGSRVAQQSSQKVQLLGPDGTPWRDGT